MAKTVSAKELAELFENISRLLKIKGESSFKTRAYENAAHAFEGYSGDLARDIEEDRLTETEGIGKSIAEKAKIYFQTGKLEFYDKLLEQFPESLLELFELQGLGEKKIKILYDELGIESISDLEDAIHAGKVAQLEGFGKKTQENLVKSIKQSRAHAGRFRLGDVAAVADELYNFLREHPAVNQVSLAGSYRRRKETVHDIDIIVSTNAPEEVANAFSEHPAIASVEAKGKTKVSVRLDRGLQCDLRLVDDQAYPFAVVYFTGSKEHNVELRGMARQRGWTLNEYAITALEDFKGKPEPIPNVNTEEELYEAFGLTMVPPELRENRGEFEAARKKRIPELIEVHHLKGAFHNHTTASDGRNTLEDMAQGAMDLGLDYLGIADHSKGQVQANGLDAKRLRKQLVRIDELNAQFKEEGNDFRLIKGIEVDILRDGSLDLEDDVLAECDYVVASVHGAFTIGEVAMTNRIIKALEHPLVTMLGHPTGRLLLQRDGYAVNLHAVLEAAADRNVIVELNANPHRLDMDWRWWPTAKDLGVKCAINPDAHSVSSLQALWFGVQIARKGWLTRDDVVNTLPWKEALGRNH